MSGEKPRQRRCPGAGLKMHLLDTESRFACMYRLRGELRSCGLDLELLIGAALKFLQREFNLSSVGVYALS